MNNRGQTGGLIGTLVFGIASLVVIVIIALVIISTINNAGFFTDQRKTGTINNESDNSNGARGVLAVNTTGSNLGASFDTKYATGTFTLVQIWSAEHSTSQGTGTTGKYNYSIGLGNATVSSIGTVTNITAFNSSLLSNVSISYTWQNLTTEEISSNDLSGNLSQGIDNISGKISTVLLVAAIVLILTILAILVGVWQRMRLEGNI